MQASRLGKAVWLWVAFLMVASMTLATMDAKAQTQKRVHIPIAANHQPVVLSGCIYPDWGCTQNDGETVRTFEDGSVILNGFDFCAYPAMGCSSDAKVKVTLFEDGSVIVVITE